MSQSEELNYCPTCGTNLKAIQMGFCPNCYGKSPQGVLMRDYHPSPVQDKESHYCQSPDNVNKCSDNKCVIHSDKPPAIRECKHEWTNGETGCMEAFCKKCNMDKPQAIDEALIKTDKAIGEDEVDELAKSIVRLKGIKRSAGWVASELIKQGYSKHPKSNWLVELDVNKVHKLLFDRIESIITLQTNWECMDLAKEICFKFGTAPRKVPSFRNIAKKAYYQQCTNDLCLGDWNNESSLVKNNWLSIGRAIHAMLTKEQK